MKYLAMLRDSFREALDSKVIYFTFGLSALLLLIVLILGFRPVSAEEKLQADLDMGRLSRLFNFGGAEMKFQFHPVRWQLSQFRQLNEGVPPWRGDYQFTLTAQLPEGVDRVVKDDDEAAVRRQLTPLMREVFQEAFRWLNIVSVQVSDDPERKRVDFEVTTEGTGSGASHWPHELSLFFGAVPFTLIREPASDLLFVIESGIVTNLGGLVVLLVGVIVTAFFIPNMLQKGSLDLLLVKPISRVELLLLKFLGGLTFVFINSIVAIGGVWLLLGAKTGIWTYSFPLTILVLTFFFAILYSVSTLFAVLTRSSVLCIFMTCLIWFLLYLLGSAHAILNADLQTMEMAQQQKTPMQMEKDKPGSDKTVADSDPILQQIGNVVNVCHTILPRTNDLGMLTTRMLSDELLSGGSRRDVSVSLGAASSYSWGESLGVSLAFIAVMLGLACWRFAVQDY
jgi:ABC-type transport system involved in multi-copper enzyme maturation permease subunit